MDSASISYIKLHKQIVKKSDFFEILKKYEKIEIIKSVNKGLKDNTVIKFRPYITIPVFEYCNLIGILNEYKTTNNLNNGLIPCKYLNTLSYKHIIKLLEFSELYNFKLPFSEKSLEKFKLHGIIK